MTTEEDFQAALDRSPRDWQTRVVFADWLQEHGDPRAEGYRALGIQRLMPHFHGTNATRMKGYWYWIGATSEDDVKRSSNQQLKYCWFAALKGPSKTLAITWEYKQFNTRREAEDAAALAYSSLSVEQRNDI